MYGNVSCLQQDLLESLAGEKYAKFFRAEYFCHDLHQILFLRHAFTLSYILPALSFQSWYKVQIYHRFHFDLELV